ncbi:GNAT family N-acetyltransferase [Microbacterium saperdae]
MTVRLTPLPAARYDEWSAATRERLIRLRQDSGLRLGEDAVTQAGQYFTELLPNGLDSTASQVLLIADGDDELGTLWLGANAGRLFVIDLALSVPPSTSQGDEIVAALQTIATGEEASLISIGLFRQDVEGHRLVDGRGFRVASIQMLLEPLPDREVAPHVVVAPMTVERYPSFADTSEAAFAVDLATSGRYSPEEAAVESRRQFLQELPQGLDTPGQEIFTATVDGVEVGILWIGMRERGGRPHAFILDIEVAADQRRKGYGRELMHATEREARRLGAGSIGLHVFGFNDAAVTLYEQLGYRRLEEQFVLDV